MHRHHVIIAICVAGIVHLGLVVLVVLVVTYDPKSHVSDIQARLAAITNVEVTYISDLTKQASQIITADIEVQGKGKMSFTGLATSSFGDTSRVRLSGIGPFRFRAREVVNGQEYRGYDIDIGPSSPIPAARRLGITNVQSAVAHYDKLLALVASWPITADEWPKTAEEVIHFADPSRGDFYFCLKR